MALLGFAVTNEVRDKSLSDSLETMLEGYDENSNLGRLRYLGSFMLLLYPLGSNVVRTACCSVGIVLPVNSPSRQSRRKIKMSNRSGFCIGQKYASSWRFCRVGLVFFGAWENVKERTILFPVYYRLELRFLFVQLPATDGAEKLYTYQLHPLFLGHTILGAVSDEVVKTIATRQPEIQ
ncbi:hypothetical protein SDJN03_04600, partial [Cucurbita argyrosperma subsp. sororia]